jgi:hypothetical protein
MLVRVPDLEKDLTAKRCWKKALAQTAYEFTGRVLAGTVQGTLEALKALCV